MGVIADGKTVVQNVRTLMNTELESSAWDYPARGLSFWCANPRLWLYACFPIGCLACASVAFTIIFFVAVFVPQALLLDDALDGDLTWLAFLLSFLLVIAEIVVFVELTVALVASLLVDPLFDEVFRLHKVPYSSSWGVSRATILFFFLEFAVCLATLVLNVVPLLGQVAFAYCTGWVFAWSTMSTYFDSLSMTASQQWRLVWRRRKDFLAFGFVAVGGMMLPVVGLVLVTTNIVGAALWAVDMEIARRKALGLPVTTDAGAQGVDATAAPGHAPAVASSNAPPRPTAPNAADVAVVVHPVTAPGMVASPGQPLEMGGVPVATEVQGPGQPPPYYK